ncbi:MAG TPA: hypothetical protein VNC78_04075 [Actinomycetota bacterium]|nr:hypothetical protein [Actinomycetota bacterium]
MRSIRKHLLVLSIITLGACSSEAPPRPAVQATGAATVSADVVASHAAQFDGELAERPAGSQAELAAATYILAHLQQAGYVARLDAVPVEDLVRSTNVVTLAEDDSAPLVVVAYDTPSSGGDPRVAGGGAVGLFLELARAVAVAAPETSVSFAAVGAESATVTGGNLGSRRLARILQENGGDPKLVILLGDIGPSVESSVWRPEGPLRPTPTFGGDGEIITSAVVVPALLARAAEVFDQVAGDVVIVSGPPDAAARSIFELLGVGSSS